MDRLAQQFNPRQQGTFLNRFATNLPAALAGGAGAPTFGGGFGGAFQGIQEQARYGQQQEDLRQQRSLQMQQFQNQMGMDQIQAENYRSLIADRLAAPQQLAERERAADERQATALSAADARQMRTLAAQQAGQSERERAAEERQAAQFANSEERQAAQFANQNALMDKRLGASAGDDDIDSFASGLESGEINMPQVPARLRAQVLERVKSRGGVILSTKQREALQKSKQIDSIINEVESISVRANASPGGISLITGAGKQAGNALGFANSVTELNAAKVSLGQIARGVAGEVGVLTEGDINRALNGFPTPMDSSEKAKLKITALRQFAETLRRGIQQTAGKNAADLAAPGTSDPLGIR